MYAIDGIKRSNPTEHSSRTIEKRNSMGAGFVFLLVILIVLLLIKPNVIPSQSLPEQKNSSPRGGIAAEMNSRPINPNKQADTVELSRDTIKFKILNASGKAGKAAALKALLETTNDSYRVISIGTIKTDAKSSITYRKDYFSAAQALNQILNKSIELTVDDKIADAQVILIIGQDF